MMIWYIVGMALERKEPLHQIVNRLDIMLPGNRPFVAPSAVIQARQRLESGAVTACAGCKTWPTNGSMNYPGLAPVNAGGGTVIHAGTATEEKTA